MTHPRSGFHRHFLGWHAPALESAARYLVELAPAQPTPDRSEPEMHDPIDLSGITVVVPGARAGRLLLERLVGIAEDRDAALLPPEIVGAGALPERLYELELPVPEPVLERLIWIDALRATPPESLLRLLPDPPPSDDEAGWDVLAAMIVEMHREVGGEGLTFRAVAESCRDGLRYNDEARWTVLAEIQARALAALRGMGFMDREEARRRALERIRASGSRLPTPPEASGPARAGHIVLVGLADLPGVTRAFLRRLPERLTVNALIHAPDERSDDFDDLGCVVPDRWEGERLGIPEGVIHVVGGPGDQADRILHAIAELEGTRSPEEITVGVPDPEVTPYVVDRLSEAGVTARPAEGRPLEHTSLFRLLQAMGEYLRSREMDSLGALVRHPVVEDWLMRANPELAGRLPMVLDRYQSLHLQARVPDPAPSGGERRQSGWADGIDALRGHLGNLLAGFSGDDDRRARALSHWPEHLRAMLLEMLGSQPLRRSVPAERETLEVIGALESVLRQMESLPPGGDRNVGATEFLRFLLGQLRGGAVPPRSETGAVELLGWLELHMDDAPVLLLSGVNEPHLPEALGADPFLPNSLRTRLGLPDNQRRWSRDLYRLQAILHSREELRLVAGRRTAGGDPLRLSRLLLAEAPELVARRILTALGDESDEGIDDVPGEEAERGPPADVGVRLPPEPVLRSERTIDSLSVTGFRSFLRDPYAFGLSEFRRLDGERDDARELDPMGFGTLAHAVLERWGRLDGADRMEEPVLIDSLVGVLDQTARDRFGTRPLPAVRIQVEQLRARLRAAACAQAARNAEGWQIRAVEARPPDPGMAFPVDGEAFYLRGRIDRVDFHPEQRIWALLDYKTSARAITPDKAHRKGRGEARRWVDLQLPLYRHLARVLEAEGGGPLIDPAAFGDGPSSIGVGYFLVPSELEKTRVAMADGWSAADLADADQTACEVVRAIRTGVVRWASDTSAIREDDPLGPVVGAGALRLQAFGEHAS